MSKLKMAGWFDVGTLETPEGSTLFVVGAPMGGKNSGLGTDVANFHEKDAADRAIACVNACEGIADLSVVPEMLTALKKIIQENPAGEGFPGFTEAAAAIRKAEGRS